MKSLYWVRNDLRLHDNPTLTDFIQKSQEGLFVWCPTKSFLRAGPFRRQFILQSVLKYKSAIESLGGVFVMAEKSAPEVIPDLVGSNQISAVYFSSEPSFDERQEEFHVDKLNVTICKHHAGSLINPRDLPVDVDSIPETFTKFRIMAEKDLKVDQPLDPPQKVPTFRDLKFLGRTFDLENSKSENTHPRIEAGEQAGLQRMQSYLWDLDRLKVYKETRNGLVNWDDSSKFSPWLSVGALSPRTVYWEIRRYESERIKNDSTYWLIFEVLWREFFRLIAEKWGAQLFTGMNGTQDVHWPERKALELFRTWSSGNTEDDFINAHMRELNQTGWMSNRGRQNVASYLCNTLRLDWRQGASYFESQLIDYDASSNWGNWAYIAGVGQSTKDRTFDPQKQAWMYDRDFKYRKLWLG